MKKQLLLLILFCALKMSAQNAPELIYYKFNSPGTTVQNEALNPVGANPAPITGTGLTIGSAGLAGTALVGTGSTGTINSGWPTNITGSFTIGFWTKDVPSSATLFYIFGDPGAGNFRCFTNGVALANNWMIRATGWPDLSFPGAATLAPNMCHAVYDAPAGQYRAYINGVLVNNLAVANNLTLINGTGLNVGWQSGAGLNGLLDEFRLYNRALTPAEILATYSMELGKLGGNNAGVSAIDSPSVFSAGLKNIKATIKNYGTNQINNVTVNWSINGVVQTPVNHNAVLDTLGGSLPNSVQLTLGNFNFLNNTRYTIHAWTTLPNGVADTITNNDSAQKVLRSPYNGNFTIGASSPDFFTITQAANELNANGINGPVTLTLIDDLYSRATGENYPATFINHQFPISIQPSPTSNPLLVDSTTSIINVDGSKYFSIDGRRNSGDYGRNITIENKSLSTTATVVRFFNDAIGGTLRNSIIRGANNTTSTTTNPSWSLVHIGGTNKANPQGNDSISIFNNLIARSQGRAFSQGIVSDGQSISAQNNNIDIDSNWIQGFSINGVHITTTASTWGNGSNFRIRGNSFYDTSVTTLAVAMNCINFIPNQSAGSNNNLISGNYIGGTSAFTGSVVPTAGLPRWEFSTTTNLAFTGIQIISGAGSGTTVSNNVIRNFRFTNPAATAGFTMINHAQGTIAINNNIIGMQSDTNNITCFANAALNGISTTSINDQTINGNSIYSITARNATTNTSLIVRGILSQSSVGAVQINNNSMGGFSVRSGNTGTSTSSSVIGIAASHTSSTIQINNNIIGGSGVTDSMVNYTTAGHRMVGIFILNSGVYSVVGNNISSFFSNSNALGTTTSSNLMGISMQATGNGHIINNNTINNFYLQAAATTTMIGILSSSGASTINSNTLSNFISNSTYTGTATGASINGIYVAGSSLQTITNNTLFSFDNTAVVSSQVNGIYYGSNNSSVISNNTIRNLRNRGYTTSVGSVVGIYMSTSFPNQTVNNNVIHSLKCYDETNSNSGVVGIYFTGSSNFTGNTNWVSGNNIHSFGAGAIGFPTPAAIHNMYGIQIASGMVNMTNNMIRLGRDSSGSMLTRPLNLRGIYITTGGTLIHRIYHNSIYLEASPQTGTQITAAYEYISSYTAPGFIDIKNNILVNKTIKGGTATGLNFVARHATNVNVFADHNIFKYDTSINNSYAGYYLGINSVNLNAFKAISNINGSSASIEPEFVNPTGDYTAVNLHLVNNNPAEGQGDSSILAFVNTDFDGAARTSWADADIGADAGAFTLTTDSIAPGIAYTALINTAPVLTRSITATIFDRYGLEEALDTPRIYYRKGAGTWATGLGTLVSGNQKSGTWQFTIDHSQVGGVLVNDIISYFIAAQDSINNNLNTNPGVAFGTINNITSYPAAPRTYTITDPIATAITVGTGGTYTTLTGPNGLFDAINRSVLQGNTEATIISDITEPGTYALNMWNEIGAGGYTLTIRPQNTTQRIVSGAIANTTGLIRLDNGVSRVNILGYPSTILTPTLADTFLVIRSSSTSTPALGLLNATNTDSVMNVILESRATSTGLGVIYIQNTAATFTTGITNITIQGCHLRQDLTSVATSLPGNGLYSVGTSPRFNTNIRFLNNFVYNFTNAGVSVQSGNGNNWQIIGNHIFHNNGAAYSSTLYYINFLPGQFSDGNTIANNWMGGTAPQAGGNRFLYTGTTLLAINISSGLLTGTTIQNNVLSKIMASNTSVSFYGAQLYGTSAVINFSGNRIGDADSSLSIVTAGNNRQYGILASTSGNLTIDNNQVLNIKDVTTGTAVAISGIQVTGGSSNTTVISNNTVRGLFVNSTNTGTLTTASLHGIYLGSSSLSQTISNNTVQTLINSNNTTANVVLGILNSSGVSNISGNTVRGLATGSSNINTASTSIPLCGIMNSTTTSGTSVIQNNIIDSIWYASPTPVASQMIGIYHAGTSANIANITGNVVKNMNTQSTNVGTSTAAAIQGIFVNNSGANQIIRGNTIHTLQHWNTTASSINGILYTGGTGLSGNNSFIDRNFIHSFRSSAPSAVVTLNGIFYAGGFSTLSNNMIRLGIDSAAQAYTEPRLIKGIYINTTTQNYFYNNSILIAGAPSSGTSNTAAIEFVSSVSSGQLSEIRNNILANTVNNGGTASGNNWCIKTIDTLRFISNYNLFYAPGTGGVVVGTNARNYPSLSGVGGWKAWSRYDLASGYGDPVFNTNALGTADVASLELQANNPAERSGDPTLTSVTVDFFGNARSSLTPNDIGAHAGNFNQSPDIFPPVISFTTLTNSGTLTGTRTLSGVTIADNNGIPVSGTTRPVIYYSKDAVNWFSNPAVTITGNATNANATFVIDYTPILPLTTSDTIRYYVIAQDNAGNIMSSAPYAIATSVNSITTHPLQPNTFNFLPIIPANTVFQVGAGQTYTSLSGVGGFFEFINSRTLGGNITAEITSDMTESGVVALGQFAEDGAGGFNLTIRPAAGTLTPRVIQGNTAQALIRLNGADRVKINGIPTSGNASDKMLLFRNSGTSYTIEMQNATQGVRIQNCIVEGANTSTVGGVIGFNVYTGPTGNMFDTISNCVVRNVSTLTSPSGVPAVCIYSNGFVTTGALNSNLVIAGNEIANFNNYGIFMNTYTGSNIRIIGNSLYNNISNQPLGNTFYPIYFNAQNYSGNNTIDGNYIGGSAANCGGTAWTKANTGSLYTMYLLFSSSGGASQVTNNIIQNINYNNVSATGQFIGIYHVAGDAIISGNTLGSGSVAGSITYLANTTHYGIYVSTSGLVQVNNNTVAGINIGNTGLSSSFFGIYFASGNLTSMNGNTIGSTTVPQSIRLNGAGSLTGIFTSVAANLAPTYAVTNNTVANLSAPGTISSINVRGIQISSNTSVPTVSGNTIRDLSTNSQNNTSLTVASNIGILYANGSNVNGTVHNNTIHALRNLNGGISPTTVMGILISSGQSPIISANRIFDLSNASTSASTNPAPVASGIAIAGASTSVTAMNNQISLGDGQSTATQFNGIWLQLNSTAVSCNLYNNSVVIGGTASGGVQHSFAFVRGNNTGSEMNTFVNVRNNIFANNRSGGSGKHYAIANQTTAATNNYWNANSGNNNLFITQNPATVGLWGNTDVNLSGWMNNALSDVYSYAAQASGTTNASQINLSNLFTNMATANLGLQTANQEVWYVYGKGIAGALVQNLNTDFNGISRGTTQGNAITIGSVQMNSVPSTAPIAALASASPAASTSTSYTFGNRTIATINWGASAPTSATLLNYTGVNPTGTVPSGNNFNQYLRVNVSGGTAPYNYGVSLGYDPAFLGAVSSFSNIKVSTETGGSVAAPVWFTNPVSTVNTGNRTVSASGITSGGLSALFFTGTENAAPPAITAFTPSAKEVNGAVTIRGSLFTGATALSFNGTSQPAFTVVNDTSITTTVPVGATTGPVSITNPYGTGTSGFNFTVIPVPTVTNLSVSTGTVGTAVTITGTGFTWATQVQFNTTNATFVVVNNTTITCTVPSGATTGLVIVINPAGNASSAGTFTVIGAPTVASLAPSSGPVGTSVTITGTNFQSITSVNFNGVSASYSVNSPTQIVATVPTTTTGTVTVINGSGTGTSSGSFTVVQLPTITGFSPTSGSAGTSVVINGSNFSNVDSVEFSGGGNAVFTVNSTTQITATVPASAGTGNITVYTNVGNVTSTGTFTIIPDLIVNSAQGVSGIYNNITVTGTGDATLTAGLLALGNVVVQTGGIARFGTNVLSGNGSFTAQTGAKLFIGSPQGITATGGLSGNIQMGGTRTYSSGVTYTYEGVTAQATGNGLPSSVDTLIINDTAGVSLTQSTTVNNVFTFMNGKLAIGNNNLTINGSINGVSPTSYIVTANTAASGGVLRRPVANNNVPVDFPVGGTALTPAQITLTAGSTADVFGVRVFNGVLQNGTTGSVVNSSVVNRTWVINENTAGGSNATVSLSWDDTLETGSFARGNCGVFYSNAGGWVPPSTFGSATGSNPYSMSRSGMAAFGAFSVGDAVSTLPVQLLNLSANQVSEDVVVHWSTASEFNNSHFEVERSVDGKEYTKAGEVEGKGYSSDITNYSFTDLKVLTQINTGVIYYRLKQVDADGKTDYFGPVAVNLTKPALSGGVQVFPNPFSNVVTLNVLNGTGGIMKVMISDMQGREVYSSDYMVNKGNQSIHIETLKDLKDGVYFMNASLNGTTQRVKLVKAGN